MRLFARILVTKVFFVDIRVEIKIGSKNTILRDYFMNIRNGMWCLLADIQPLRLATCYSTSPFMGW